MSFFKIIYLLFLTISSVGILIETFTYSGLIKSHFYLDPRILVLFCVLIAALNLLHKRPDQLPKNFIKLNNFILLPFFTITTLIFTILELINYPNYVFSTFHIHYDSIFYFLILSFSIFLFSLNRKKISANKEKVIFGFSIFLIICLFLIRTWPGGIFFRIIREDNLFENLQFIFYILAAFLSFLLTIRSFKNKSKLTTIYFSFFTLVLLFIAGEEISWGQRIFNISSPVIAIQNNTQQETTIHNLRGLNDLQFIFYIIFSLYLSSAWIFIKTFPKKMRNQFSQFTPDWYFSFYFIPIFIFYIHANFLGGNYWEWQEACELLLSIGIFIFTSEKIGYKKLK